MSCVESVPTGGMVQRCQPVLQRPQHVSRNLLKRTPQPVKRCRSCTNRSGAFSPQFISSVRVLGFSRIQLRQGPQKSVGQTDVRGIHLAVMGYYGGAWCRWLWCERLGHEIADLAIEYHPLAESELINCTGKHFAKAERLHADLEKLVQQRRVDITASRRRMNNLVRELKSMNWVWSRGTDRLFGWQHDLELRALLEEVRPVPKHFPSRSPAFDNASSILSVFCFHYLMRSA